MFIHGLGGCMQLPKEQTQICNDGGVITFILCKSSPKVLVK